MAKIKVNHGGIKKTKTNSWASNVLKSMGYSAADVLGVTLPTTMDIAKSNAEVITEMIRSARSMKSSNKRLLSAIDSNEYTKFVKDAIKNAKEDIRTGNINNKDRANKVILGDMADDFDFDFGDDDGGNFSTSVENDEDGSTTNVVVNTNINEDNPMVTATNKQTKAIVEVAEANQNAQFAIANRSLQMDAKMMESVTTGMQAINDNVGAIVSFNSDTMSKFTSASLAFYEETSNTLKEINESLKSMSSRGSNVAGLEGETRKPNNDLVNDVFMDGFSITGYRNLVKKQLKSHAESNIFMGPVLAALNDKDTIASLVANPLAGVSSMLVGSFIPTMLTESAKRMDESIKEFFPAMLNKIAGMDSTGNPILTAFAEIFGVKAKTKSGVELDRYNKGPTPFDGQTKKAIVDVIPTYLRKILSAVSQQPEMVMDWEKGTFRKFSDIKEDWDKSVRYATESGISGIVSKMQRRMDAFEFANKEDKVKLDKDLTKAISAIIKSNSTPNLNTNDDSLKDIYDMGSTSANRLLKQLIKSLSKTEQLKLFGSGRLESRAALSDLYTKAEEEMNANNAFTLLGDSTGNKSYKAGTDNLLVGADKYGITPAMYLRDIRSLLTDGIVVFSGGGVAETSGSLPSHISNAKSKYSREDKELRKIQHPDKTDNYKSEDDKDKLKRQGKIGVNSLTELSDLSEQQLYEAFVSMDDDENESKNPMTKTIAGKRWALLKSKINNVKYAPAKLLSGLFDKVDDTLYKMVFGTEKGGSTSFFLSAFEKLGDRIMTAFDKTWTFMEDKFFKPIKEFLVDGDNSLKAMFDRSEFKKNMTAKWGDFKNYIFGDMDKDGIRSGGLLSDTYNQFKSTGLQVRNYITGAEYVDPITGVKVGKNEDSVFSHFNASIKSYTTSIKHYLFGDKDNPSGKGILGEGLGRIKEGFQSWADALFGHRIGSDGTKLSNLYIDDFTRDIKEKAPKALSTGMIGAGVGMANMIGGGFLPSLFLPGGPIGGMLVGTTIGFLSQSESFKNVLFGTDDGKGNRINGLISKETQDFFKKHKDAMIGGASLGALKSMLGIGILPGLVGGPITGAALGIGSSLLFRSETFKKMLFGDEVDGKRVGGIAGKIAGFMKDENGNNVFGKVGAGVLGGAGIGLVASKFGLLGSLFLGGPLGGAMMGLAGGLALTNDKWKKALFGEWDADNHIRKGGVFGKFINWTKLQIFEPLKLKFEEINLNIGEWFEKSIGNKFADAVYPIKKEFENMVQSMKDLFKKGWEDFTRFLGNTFENFVGKPFGDVMEEKILKPLKKFFSGIVNGVGRFAGAILSSPFKALSYVADGLQGKHERQGVSKMRENAMDALFDPTKRKEDQGWFGALKDVFKAYFSAATIDAAKKMGAPYAEERERERNRRDAETDEKWRNKRLGLDKKKQDLNDRLTLAKLRNYDNVYIDDKGNEIIDTDPYKPKPFNTNESISIGKPSGYKNRYTPDDKPYKPNKNTNTEFSWGKKEKGGNVHHDSPFKPTNYNNYKPKDDEKLVEGTKPILNSSGGFKAGSIMKGSPQRLLGSIAKDVRTIASEVYGQFNGVGSNVYKIRKIVQGSAGISDTDLGGSSNKDRKGFGGKLRSLLYRPFSGILGIGSGILNGGMSVIEGILSIPNQVFGAFKGLLGDVYTGLKNVGKSLLGIPGLLVDGVKLGVKSLGAIIGAIGPMIGSALKGAGEAIGATISGIGHTLEGAGKALGVVLEDSAKAVGSLIKGISDLVPVLFNFATNMFEFTSKAIIKTTSGVLTGLLGLAGGALGLVTSPIKTLTGLGRSVGNKLLPQKTKMVISGSESTLPVKVMNPIKISTGGGTSNAPGLSLTAANEIEESKMSSAEIVSSHTGNETPSEKEESLAAELEERQADVTSETAAKRKAEAEFKSKEERQQEYQNKVLETLRQNTQATTEHTSIWSSIFGKKGAITSLLLLGVPMILSILKSLNLGEVLGGAMKSLWDYVGHKNDETRQTETGEIINDQEREETFVKAGVKGGVYWGKRAVEGFVRLHKTVKSGKSIFDKIFRKSSNGIVDDAAEATIKNIDDVAEVLAKENADDIATAIAKNSGDDVLKEIGEVAIKKSSQKASKNIPKFIDDLVEVCLKGAKKYIKDDSVILKIAKNVSSIFKKFLPKLSSFTDDIAKAMAEDGAKFASGIGDLIQLVFTAYDLASGAAEASRIFQVPKDYPITIGMRVAAGLCKALIGLTATGMLLHTLIEQICGVNVQRLMAEAVIGITDAFLGNSVLSSIKDAQNELQYRRNEYNDEHGTQLSTEAYIDMTDPSLFAKLFRRNKVSENSSGGAEFSMSSFSGKEFLLDEDKGRGRLDNGRPSRPSNIVDLSEVKLNDRSVGGTKTSVPNTSWKDKIMDILTGRKNYNKSKKERALVMATDAAEFNKVIEEWEKAHPGEKMPYNEFKYIKDAWGIKWETEYEKTHKFEVTDYIDARRKKIDENKKRRDAALSRRPTASDNNIDVLGGIKRWAKNTITKAREASNIFETSDYVKERRDKIDENRKRNDAALSRRPGITNYTINTDPNNPIERGLKFAERQLNKITRFNEKLAKALKGEESIIKLAEQIGKSVLKVGKNISSWVGDTTKGLWDKFINATSTDVDLRGDRTNQVASTRLSGDFMRRKYNDVYQTLGLKGSGNMKYYSQKDPKWSSFGVGGGRMSDLGCGPTAMAMVASSMGVNANPAVMQHYANTGGYADSSGVNANFINSSANALGIRANQVLAPGVGNIADGLQRGPMVLLGRSGENNSPYTNAGHYVVATKAGNGFVNIKDPNGPSGNKRVPISSLGGTMSAWSFEGSGPTRQYSSGNKSFALNTKRASQMSTSNSPRLISLNYSVTDAIKNGTNATQPTAKKSTTASENTTTVGDGSLMYENSAEIATRDLSNAMSPTGGPAGEQVANFMMSLEGRFKYSQKAGRENPEKSGYSDCSSTCAYCYRMVAGINTGGWTGAMLSHGVEVARNSNGDKGFLQRPDVMSALKPGDLIIFGRGSKTAHVEMYVGNGQLSGHGGPKNGPTRKDITSYRHKYPVLQIRRYCDDAGNALKPGDKVGVGNLNEMNTGSDASTGLGILGGFAADLGKLIGRVLFGEDDGASTTSTGFSGGDAGAGINKSLKSFSPITAQQLNDFIDSKGKGKSGKLHGMGQAIIDASNATGLDPRYILAHAAWESGWGTSKTAMQKNNFFGIGAYNKAPFKNAKTFSGGPAEGIMAGAKWINNRYINGGADTLYKMITMSPPGPYCVDDNGQPSMSWANGIYGIMSQMGGAGDGNTVSLGDGSLLPQPSSVVLGQNRPIDGGRVPVRNMSGAGRTQSQTYSVNELKEIVSILRSIDTNTGNTSTKIGVLIDRYGQPIKGSGNTSSKSGNVTPPPKQYIGDKSPSTSEEQSKSYILAKQIAKGKLA